MKKIIPFMFLYIFIPLLTIAQAENNIFTSIEKEMKEYRPDTTAVPNDRITRKIREIRLLRGGFDVENALQFKLSEAKSSGEITGSQYEQLINYFTNGAGFRQLENAVTWLYRREFSYHELKKIARFYKTEAGKKMADRFPFIMVKSIAAMEMIGKQVAGSK